MGNTLTPEFRVSYPNVFVARKNELSDVDEYSVVALFPKDADLTPLKQAAQEAIEKKWGTDKSKWPTNLRSPFRKNEEKKKTAADGSAFYPDGYEEGGVFMNLKSRQKPGVVDAKVQDIIDPMEFYAGCWARATVTAYAYDQKGNRGVAFGLGNLQKTKEGDLLGGRTKPQADFAAVDTIDEVAKDAGHLFD